MYDNEIRIEGPTKRNPLILIALAIGLFLLLVTPLLFFTGLVSDLEGLFAMMKFLVVFSVVVVCCVCIFGAIIRTLMKKANLEIYQNLARKYTGHIKDMGLLYALVINYKGVEAIVVSMPSTRRGSGYSPPSTEIRGQVPSSMQKELSVFVNSKVHTFLSPEKVQGIHINELVFDKNFVVQGDDEVLTRDMLNTNVRNRLAEMITVKPLITLRNNQLVFHVEKYISTEHEYEYFIDFYISLIEAVQNKQAEEKAGQ